MKKLRKLIDKVQRKCWLTMKVDWWRTLIVEESLIMKVDVYWWGKFMIMGFDDASTDAQMHGWTTLFDSNIDLDLDTDRTRLGVNLDFHFHVVWRMNWLHQLWTFHSNSYLEDPIKRCRQEHFLCDYFQKCSTFLHNKIFHNWRGEYASFWEFVMSLNWICFWKKCCSILKFYLDFNQKFLIGIKVYIFFFCSVFVFWP